MRHFARRFFAGTGAGWPPAADRGGDFTVVGVVKDIKYRSLAETPQPYFYLSMHQARERFTGIGLYRTDRGTATAARARTTARIEIRRSQVASH